MPQRNTRPNGFGLGYGHNVEDIDSALANIEEGRRGVMVERDGMLTALAVGSPAFLGWGTSAIPPPGLAFADSMALNPYVLADYSLEFARFVREILMPTVGTDQGWMLGVVGRELKSGEPVLFLPGVGASQVDSDSESFPASSEAETDAYELLRQFVAWFGSDAVPFAEDGRISAETVRTWR
jgi:hypothetical protein